MRGTRVFWTGEAMERRTSVTSRLGPTANDAKEFLKSVSGELLQVSGPGFEWLDERVHDKTFSGRFRVLWVSAGTVKELTIRAVTAQGETGYLHVRFPVEGEVWLIDNVPVAADGRRDDNLRGVFG